MKKYDNVDIEIIKLGDNRAIEASGEKETNQNCSCVGCSSETEEQVV